MFQPSSLAATNNAARLQQFLCRGWTGTVKILRQQHCLAHYIWSYEETDTEWDKTMVN